MSKATALPTVPEPLALPLTLLSLVRCCLTSQPPFPVPHTSAPFLLTFVLNRKHCEWWRWWFIHNLITDFTFVHDHHKSISLLGWCHTKQLFFINICANFSLSAKSRWQIFSHKKPKYSVAFGATLSATFRGKLGFFQTTIYRKTVSWHQEGSNSDCQSITLTTGSTTRPQYIELFAILYHLKPVNRYALCLSVIYLQQQRVLWQDPKRPIWILSCLVNGTFINKYFPCLSPSFPSPVM